MCLFPGKRSFEGILAQVEATGGVENVDHPAQEGAWWCQVSHPA